MNIKKVDLHFGDCLAGIEVEYQGEDCFSLCLTEFQENEEKSTQDHKVIETRFTTEVFLSSQEIKSLINTLTFLLNESEVDE